LKTGQLAARAILSRAPPDRYGPVRDGRIPLRSNKDSTSYTASFQVVEVTPLYPVQFTGLPVKTAEIEAWLKSKDPFYGPGFPRRPSCWNATRSWCRSSWLRRTRPKSGRQASAYRPEPVRRDLPLVEALPTIAQVTFTAPGAGVHSVAEQNL